MSEKVNQSVRESIEQRQNQVLNQYASKPTETRGRLNDEAQDDIRTPYQLDRDRILYSREFRRLKFKTQVFIETVNDDTRTRLTHTLEVMQISRTLARALNLNEDLAEAIALGHDIGHTPFAHAGEEVLDELSEDGFHHSNQSLRVVDRLSREGEGLNLTQEVRDGIVKHSKSESSMFDSVTGVEPITLEGKIVRMCDSIAYVNHDIDDALKAGVLESADLPDGALRILGEHGGDRIDRSIRDIIDRSMNEPDIKMSDEIREATDELRSFMFDNVYLKLGDRDISEEARKVVKELFDYFRENPEHIYRDKPFLEGVPLTDAVIDFLTLQSDRSIIQLYKEHVNSPLKHLPDY